MSTPNNGGPAFPVPPPLYIEPANKIIHGDDEMSLRDYMAIEVMKTIYAGDGARMVAARDGRYDETNWGSIVASNAYMMADAMLAERAKKS